MKNYGAEKILIWMCACSGLDQRECAALLRAAKTPEELFVNYEKYFSKMIKSDAKRLYKDSGLPARERELNEFLIRMDRAGAFCVTILDDDYPESLRAVPVPPLLLYGTGRRELLRSRKFCIVGSRITPPWAEKLGCKFSERLSEYFAVVTGLAEGGDSAAVRGALESGNLICVLPNGLDLCYPASHVSLKKQVAERGLLLSEYPPGKSPKKYYFHARNRILAGLSEGTLVLSAGMKSGALITAGLAAEYGRDVFAFPYSPGISQGAGCNELIKKGAFLCTEPNDILLNFGIREVKKALPPLGEEEKQVLAILKESGELHMQTIAERTRLQIFEIASVLAALELKGLAVKAGGNRYAPL